jgi:hypothetical protein
MKVAGRILLAAAALNLTANGSLESFLLRNGIEGNQIFLIRLI